MDAVGLGTAVAFQVHGQQPARAFRDGKYRLLWRGKTLGPDFEVMDQGFHAHAEFRARRRYEFTVGTIHGAVRQHGERLPDDAHRLAHFIHAHLVPSVDVAGLLGGNVEVVLIVAAVRLGLA